MKSPRRESSPSPTGLSSEIGCWATPGKMNVVSERFVSRAMPCISVSVRPRASVKTANWFPSSGTLVKTSIWTNARRRFWFDMVFSATYPARFSVTIKFSNSPEAGLKAFRKMLQRTPFYGVYKALGHYPDYWYWMLRGKPIRSPHLLKQFTVRDYGKRYGLKVLIE